MGLATDIVGLAGAAFIGLVVCLEIGLRIGLRHAAKQPGSAYEGSGSIEAAVFALLSRLLAFSRSGTTGHLDYRRQLIVQEANAISTAYISMPRS
jgi:hypothetical protein